MRDCLLLLAHTYACVPGLHDRSVLLAVGVLIAVVLFLLMRAAPLPTFAMPALTVAALLCSARLRSSRRVARSWRTWTACSAT